MEPWPNNDNDSTRALKAKEKPSQQEDKEPSHERKKLVLAPRTKPISKEHAPLRKEESVNTKYPLSSIGSFSTPEGRDIQRSAARGSETSREQNKSTTVVSMATGP